MIIPCWIFRCRMFVRAVKISRRFPRKAALQKEGKPDKGGFARIQKAVGSLTVDVCAAPDPLGMVRLVRSSLRPRIALAVKAVDIDRCINDFTDRHFTGVSFASFGTSQEWHGRLHWLTRKNPNKMPSNKFLCWMNAVNFNFVCVEIRWFVRFNTSTWQYKYIKLLSLGKTWINESRNNHFWIITKLLKQRPADLRNEKRRELGLARSGIPSEIVSSTGMGKMPFFESWCPRNWYKSKQWINHMWICICCCDPWQLNVVLWRALHGVNLSQLVVMPILIIHDSMIPPWSVTHSAFHMDFNCHPAATHIIFKRHLPDEGRVSYCFSTLDHFAAWVKKSRWNLDFREQ